MDSANTGEWITMAAYAARAGISRVGVLKAVREGRLESNGKTGRECRVRGEIMPSTYAAEPRRRKQAAKSAQKPAPKAAPAPEPEMEPEAEAEAPEGDTLFDMMTDAKLKKLKADIALQRQRLNENRDAMRRKIYEEISEAYAVSFAALKTHIVELRLPAAKLAALRKIMEESIALFEAELRKKQDV